MFKKPMTSILLALFAASVMTIFFVNTKNNGLETLRTELSVLKIGDTAPSFFSTNPLLSSYQRAKDTGLQKERLSLNLNKLKVPFISNQGQVNKKVKFYANTFGGTISVMENGEISYELKNSELLPTGSSHEHSALPLSVNKVQTESIALRERIVGGNISDVKGEEKSVTRVNYFKGDDHAQWKNDIETYDTVNLGQVCDGIEMKLKAYAGNVEKLFYVKPNSSPEKIQMIFDGARKLSINEEGELIVETDHGAVKFTKPEAYQYVEDKKINVAIAYNISSALPDPSGYELVYSFAVGDYDKSLELVIDPLLASTFLGGKGSYDIINSMAVDLSGNVYVAGTTTSSSFPTTKGSYDITCGTDGKCNKTTVEGAASTYFESDIFISKFNSDLTTLLASTYIGGSKSEYSPSIAIDANGNIFVAGQTLSQDFPVTANGYKTQFSGTSDLFISKFNSELATLSASTFLGGNNQDFLSQMKIAIDTAGSLYITGDTFSEDFPTTTNAYETKYLGPSIFISKLNSELTTLLASTLFYGGKLSSDVESLSLDSKGNVYLSGKTLSTDFPLTNGAYNTTFKESSGFVAKFSGDLTTLLASTLTVLGYAANVSLDVDNNVYVAGETECSELSNGYNNSIKGQLNLYVLKLNSDLTTLLSSACWGGHDPSLEVSVSKFGALEIGPDGNIYVTGATKAIDFPVTAGAYDTFCDKKGVCSSTVFVSKFDKNLSSLLASTYLGGNSGDAANALAFDSKGNVYVAGTTNSADFPTTKGAYSNIYHGRTKESSNAFIAKLDPDLSSDKKTYLLTIESSATDSGAVTSSPSGINCGEKCSGSFVFNKKITLSAKPATGYAFQEWGGACTGKGKCIVKMDSDKSVTATFIKLDPEISIPNSVVTFGNVKVNNYSKKAVRIINKGKGILTITGSTVDNSEFTSSSQNAVNPRSKGFLYVTFSPTSTGPKTATVTITSDDPKNPTMTVTLKGTGK